MERLAASLNCHIVHCVNRIGCKREYDNSKNAENWHDENYPEVVVKRPICKRGVGEPDLINLFGS